jgi:hypothetical protein
MLYENLHGVVKKTQAVKLMADLAVAGKVVEKLKGKQKIYWASQVRRSVPPRTTSQTHQTQRVWRWPCCGMIVIEQEGLVIADTKGLAKLDKEIESLRVEKKAIAAELGEIGGRKPFPPLDDH